MEPHREEQPKAPEPGAEQKPRRFRIVKLEERIAPGKGGGGPTHGNTCHCGFTNGGASCDTCTCGCW
jgi:hypothetical protein